MTTENRKILVPYDFTEKSEYAFKHAIQVAKIVGTDIVLLHVIESIAEEAQHHKKLEEAADVFRKKYGVNIECKIRSGIVHKIIKIYAETIDAFMVIMKTQPPSQKERLFGSRSIRVMGGSQIPFIVVQETPKRLAFRKVVFPIDFRAENKEKLIWISTLSKYYTPKIYLFKPKIKDYNVRNNLEFSKRFLEGKNIDYEIVTNESEKSLADATLDFAHEMDAHLIIIMLKKNITKLNLLFGAADQKYISNKYKIPVMCLNPRIELHRYGGFF
jgi:nucleotide-binding universal stress UspA family protein